jgi:hypothetical protein
VSRSSQNEKKGGGVTGLVLLSSVWLPEKSSSKLRSPREERSVPGVRR